MDVLLCLDLLLLLSLILSVVVYFSLERSDSDGLELITYYVISGSYHWSSSYFLPHRLYTLTNTKGRMVGYKDHKTYGDSSIYENTPGDNTKFYLELGG